MYVCSFVPKTRFQHEYIENSHENMYFFIFWFGVVRSPWKAHLMLTSPYFHKLDVRSSHTNGLNPKGPWMRHFVFDFGIQLNHVEWTVTNSDRWRTSWFIRKAGFQEPVQYAKQFFCLDLFDIWLPMQLSLSLMLRWKHWEMDHVRYHLVKLT